MSRCLSFFRIPALAVAVAFFLGAQAPQSQSPATATGPATLIIKGDIPSQVTLTSQDLASLPRETASVTEEDGSKVVYEGVLLREVLARAGAPAGSKLRGKALASYVIAHAHDGYQVVFTLGELDPSFGNSQILVADKRDGKPLFGYQGPLRLVCPNDKAGARSVRMLESLEFIRLAK
jgi:DMSO/TMAO reductase YedYZ molybdopterin-dependent catalytic subunit